MNLAELKDLKNTPKSEMRNLINGLNAADFPRNRALRRDIENIQAGGKFYPSEFLNIVESCCRELVKANYYNDDNEPIFNITIVNALVSRDLTGEAIPEYIKQLPGWSEVIEAGLA